MSPYRRRFAKALPRKTKAAIRQHATDLERFSAAMAKVALDYDLSPALVAEIKDIARKLETKQ